MERVHRGWIGNFFRQTSHGAWGKSPPVGSRVSPDRESGGQSPPEAEAKWEISAQWETRENVICVTALLG